MRLHLASPPVERRSVLSRSLREHSLIMARLRGVRRPTCISSSLAEAPIGPRRDMCRHLMRQECRERPSCVTSRVGHMGPHNPPKLAETMSLLGWSLVLPGGPTTESPTRVGLSSFAHLAGRPTETRGSWILVYYRQSWSSVARPAPHEWDPDERSPRLDNRRGLLRHRY
jgi:hypothetical protein